MGEIFEIFHAALAGVDPQLLVRRSLRLQGSRLACGPHSFDLDNFPRRIVVGAGKAAAGMGLAVEALLGGRISRGLLSLPRGDRGALRLVATRPAGHPLPDSGGARAGRGILAMLRNADERTLALCLLSGGASAMLAAPVSGLPLADKRRTTSLLLAAGAAISELNAVRKHLSRVKGGRLAAEAFPATVLTLALSDVAGDAPEVIGSGPTVADPSTFADALAALDRYGLRERVPVRARRLLERGAAGMAEETPKPGDPRLARAAFAVIGGNRTALAAAKAKAAALGMKVEIQPSPLQGEARQAGRALAAAARRIQQGLLPEERRCLLAGGETTVTVRGDGVGGRNQELALAFALEIAGCGGIELLSAGSDGVDGPTDAAGAVVDGGTAARASQLGLDAAALLENNDSHSFFSELDRRGGGRALVRTGPTGTNVADLQIVLIRRPRAI